MVPGTRADLSEADWVSDELKNEPHVALGCGHLSPPGTGPLAGAGYGYCRYHGVSPLAPAAVTAGPGNTGDAGPVPLRGTALR